jgi:hypothetical protein
MPSFLEDFDAVTDMVEIDAGSMAPGLELQLGVMANEEVFLVVAHLE